MKSLLVLTCNSRLRNHWSSTSTRFSRNQSDNMRLHRRRRRTRRHHSSFRISLPENIKQHLVPRGICNCSKSVLGRGMIVPNRSGLLVNHVPSLATIFRCFLHLDPINRDVLRSHFYQLSGNCYRFLSSH